MRLPTRLAFLAITALATVAAADEGLDADRIGAAAGVKATTTADGVVRIAWERDDVPVKVDGVPFKPFAGVLSWAAFSKTPHAAMVMGDTVVFQDEASPALDAALAAGLEVTAIHNHLFFDEPKVYYMHIGGMGAPEKLAAGVKEVWDAIKKVRAERPTPATGFGGDAVAAGVLDAEAVGRVIGHKGQTKDGVVRLFIGREGSMHGVAIGGSMGLGTLIAFSGSNERAAVAGDFSMTAGEVQTVLRALRKAGFHVVALHNHMIGEEPSFYFAHFWAKGPAGELARGLRSVLDAQAAAPGAAKGH